MGLFTIAIGVAIYRLGGNQFDVAFPSVLSYPGYRDPFPNEFSDYMERYTPIGIWTLVSLAIGLIGAYAIRKFSLSLASLRSLIAAMKEHRTRIMIGFVVVMLPVVILRNVLDPENRSAPHFTAIGVLFLSLITASSVVLGLARLINKRRQLASIIFVLAVFAISGVVAFNSRSGDYGELQATGFMLAVLIGPGMFFLTLIFAGKRSQRDHHVRTFSAWSILIPALVCGALIWASYRFDTRVMATSLAGSPETFFYGDWCEASMKSRQLQLATDGAVSLIHFHGQRVVYIKIEGDWHANCLRTDGSNWMQI